MSGNAHANCLFCGIIARAVEASVVYQDDVVTAFMDLFPVVPGHTLVIPNEHSDGLDGVRESAGARIWTVGRRIALSFAEAGIRAEGANFFLANGAVAGQTVFHCHLHVIPRFAGDGFGFAHGVFHRTPAERSGLDQQARSLAATLARVG